MARGIFLGVTLAGAIFAVIALSLRLRARGSNSTPVSGYEPPDPIALNTIRRAESFLAAQNNELGAERNELQAERNELQAERARLQEERVQLQSDKGILYQSVESQVAELQVERSQIQAERLQLQADRGKLYATAQTQVDEIQAERARLAEERGKLYRDAEGQVAEIREEGERRRAELERVEERIDRLEKSLTERGAALGAREQEVVSQSEEIAGLRGRWDEAVSRKEAALERVANLTVAEARAEIADAVRNDAKRDAMQYVRELEERSREEAERRARRIVGIAIQRVAAETVSEATVSVVPIPSEETKGRIIGREGRNIRAFETITGVNLIIDDAPDAVLLSCFDPVRREMARLALESLVADGRIHPTRIEEAFAKAGESVDVAVRQAGEWAQMEAGISNLHPELVRALGRLKYRYSYGQNVLDHLVESSHIAAMMSAEMGIAPETVRRGTLLHDIGKALTHEVGGSHAIIGAELARRLGEAPAICHIIESHHNEVEQRTVEAVLAQAADQLSGGRPGARRESLESYVKRLEKLEEICLQHAGVEKAYAMQAGRDVRVMVDPAGLDDVGAQVLARDIAREIEDELQYPGQIRVTVVRETRATEYAK